MGHDGSSRQKLGRPNSWLVWRARLVAFASLLWLSLAEWKILERLYADPASRAFVAESVRGVLARTPVSKSWSHRFVAPWLVSALGGASAEGTARFAALTLFAANGLLFVLLRRRGVRVGVASVAALAFGLARLVLAYKLEYPWDGVDQLVFLAFGAWAASGGSLVGRWPVLPLLLIGAFNHETILYVPLWYLLGPDRRDRAAGVIAGAAIAAIVGVTRALAYVGPPALPGQVFEPPTPLVENHLHVAHNLEQLFVANWTHGRVHVSVGFLSASALLAWRALRAASAEARRAAAWSLVVLGTVVAFGYVNETRHYVVLVAFWAAFAPKPTSELPA